MTELARSYAEANQELLASFRRYMEARGLSPCTIRAYGDALDQFARIVGSASLVDAKRTEVHSFLAALLKRGLSDGSLHVKTAALRCFFKFLRLAGLIQIDPMLQVGHRKIRTRLPRVLTIAEVEALIGAARTPKERAVLEVMYATGVRVSELVNIRIENIDFAEHIILIRRGKGSKDRFVLYGSSAARAIAEYLAVRPTPHQEGFLFQPRKQRGSTNERCHTRFIAFLVSRAGGRAGLRAVHPHSLRRAMACHMLQGGAHIRFIQELLGHKKLATTQIYTTLTGDDLQKTYAKCHPHADSIGANDAQK